MALIKARFRCESCDAETDIAGPTNSYGEYLRALQEVGWKVVAEGWSMKHYCPNCEAKL